MSWTYKQSTGELSHKGTLIYKCYSGHEAGLNNPAYEADPGIGPIPVGLWTIGTSYTNPHTGPVTMNLDPVAPFNAHGRTLFRMHGDNTAGNESASRGCIIAPRPIREAVAASSDHMLQVIA